MPNLQTMMILLGVLAIAAVSVFWVILAFKKSLKHELINCFEGVNLKKDVQILKIKKNSGEIHERLGALEKTFQKQQESRARIDHLFEQLGSIQRDLKALPEWFFSVDSKSLGKETEEN